MYVRPLPAVLSKIAQDELNEVPDRVAEDIQVLRDWIEKQPHLKARTSDQFLIAFLRGCKFSLEKAKQKLDYFYTIKMLTPELFKNRAVDQKTLDIVRIGCLLRLPAALKEDGPRIHVSRYGQYDPKKYSIGEILKVSIMMSEIQMMEDDNAMVNGFVEICDMGGVSFSHVLQFDPILIKKTSVLGETAIPFRIKGMHFINVPKEAMAALNLARSFLGEKLKSRFNVHKNLESLYQSIPKEYLPKEYGGENGTIDEVIATWVEKLNDYKGFFADDQLYGTNESLRTDKKINSNSLFGFDGSFRKLDVD